MKKFAITFCLALFAKSGQGDDQVDCHLPLDVMFVQDTTGSFTEDLPNVVNQIPDMLTDIKLRHPHSRFGVVEFHDKPFPPLGEPHDFCYLLGQGLSSDVSVFQQAYARLGAWGGVDGPEASYNALINALEDEQVGWRPLAVQKDESLDPSYAGARVVILSTDAVPHLPGDCLKYDASTYPQLPRNLPPYSGSPYPMMDEDIDWQCTAQDYPSPDQVLDVFRKHSAYLVILTPEDPAVTAAWKWVNEDLFSQPTGFYQYIKSDSSDLLEGVLNALEAVTEIACATTTENPRDTTTHTIPIDDMTRRPAEGVSVIFPKSTTSLNSTIEDMTRRPAEGVSVIFQKSTTSLNSTIEDMTRRPAEGVSVIFERSTNSLNPTIVDMTRRPAEGVSVIFERSTNSLKSTRAEAGHLVDVVPTAAALTDAVSTASAATSELSSPTGPTTTGLELSSTITDSLSPSSLSETAALNIPTIAPLASTEEASTPLASTTEASVNIPTIAPLASTEQASTPLASTTEASVNIPTIAPLGSTEEASTPLASTTEASVNIPTIAPLGSTEEASTPLASTTEASVNIPTIAPLASTEQASTPLASTLFATTDGTAMISASSEALGDISSPASSSLEGVTTSEATTTLEFTTMPNPSSVEATTTLDETIVTSSFSSTIGEDVTGTSVPLSLTEETHPVSDLSTDPLEALTETSSSKQDKCCPHVHIKMMKAPKQWKMLVVN